MSPSEVPATHHFPVTLADPHCSNHHHSLTSISLVSTDLPSTYGLGNRVRFIAHPVLPAADILSQETHLCTQPRGGNSSGHPVAVSERLPVFYNSST